MNDAVNGPPPEHSDAVLTSSHAGSADPFAPLPAGAFPRRQVMATRWSDNDMYGHLNNAVYYQLFDTVVNVWAAEALGDDFTHAPVIGVVAQSGCRFHAEARFPGCVTIGYRATRIGRTSITYHLALFADASPAADATPVATGRWVHVYVSKGERRPVPVPERLRAAVNAHLLVEHG